MGKITIFHDLEVPGFCFWLLSPSQTTTQGLYTMCLTISNYQILTIDRYSGQANMVKKIPQNGPKGAKSPYFITLKTQDADFGCYNTINLHIEFIYNLTLSNYKLPNILTLVGPKRLKKTPPKWPEMGKITIFHNLEDLECWFGSL